MRQEASAGFKINEVLLCKWDLLEARMTTMFWTFMTPKFSVQGEQRSSGAFVGASVLSAMQGNMFGHDATWLGIANLKLELKSKVMFFPGRVLWSKGVHISLYISDVHVSHVSMLKIDFLLNKGHGVSCRT